MERPPPAMVEAEVEKVRYLEREGPRRLLLLLASRAVDEKTLWLERHFH